jgi:ribosomal protein S18 acetylase RimI-like enzyme
MRMEVTMDPVIKDFEIADYKGAFNLWTMEPNIGISSADHEGNIAQFLRRNPGLSKVAVVDGRIIATILCGHDGRRGYIYHLCVDDNYRRKGLARSLVNACLDGLRKEKIQKCHLFVFYHNEMGNNFWSSTGWKKRDDIYVFSKNI